MVGSLSLGGGYASNSATSNVVLTTRPDVTFKECCEAISSDYRMIELCRIYHIVGFTSMLFGAIVYKLCQTDCMCCTQ
jgi:hypothetical protein